MDDICTQHRGRVLAAKAADGLTWAVPHPSLLPHSFGETGPGGSYHTVNRCAKSFAERSTSATPGSRSAAEAGGSRLQAIVRP